LADSFGILAARGVRVLLLFGVVALHALREALANAVIHGCKGDPKKKIECSVTGGQDRGILIVVSDPGDGFDPARVPCPTDGQNLFSDHGRGIFLISRLMDEVQYERNGAKIRMRKY
jgi:serine/threonine-protein kinase RsbW